MGAPTSASVVELVSQCGTVLRLTKVAALVDVGGALEEPAECELGGKRPIVDIF